MAIKIGGPFMTITIRYYENKTPEVTCDNWEKLSMRIREGVPQILHRFFHLKKIETKRKLREEISDAA